MKFPLPFLAALLFQVAVVYAQDAVLRSGDTIEIRLGGVPPEEIQQVSGQYQVDGQGFVNMPHIGKIKAADVTQANLQNAIESAYRGQQIYSNPTITLSVPTTARFVNVGGDVKSPRRVEFTPDLTVLSAITACGGFTEYADQKKIKLLRDGKVTVVNVPEIRKNPSKDIRLKPGDSLEVPQSFW
ncbi:MAG: polysaccharide biosynthesis/export family protein [Terrimicrobiaceae bacterium]|jgi:protein involved in polysaccharide export with SLBB domain